MTCKSHRSLLLGILAFAVAACAGPPERPERVVERVTADAPTARGPALLRRAMIDGHNAARAEAGVPPLVWSDTLAASAKAHADTMARTGRFAHADQPRGTVREGENLFTGTRYDYGYAEMVGYWLAEKKDFVNRPMPGFTRTGRWQDVAHYTQVVWRRTTAVGCALSSSAADDYLVCRYSPSGNVMGEPAY